MRQCPRGHLYDETTHTNCPYCAGNSKFQSIGLRGQSDFPKTMGVNDPGIFNGNIFPPTIPVDNVQSRNDEMSVTISIDETKEGIKPVRGWLVVINGEQKGTSFIIHGEQNSIGRGSKFDINISFDRTVSSEGNAVIVYDSKNCKFFISPVIGKGKNNIYCNDNMLLSPTILNDYDKIQIGTFTYVFRSFCNENFTY